MCHFETGDLRVKVNGKKDFDLVILGAVGHIFGDYQSTIKALAGCLNPDGCIIIDDAYIEDGSGYEHEIYKSRSVMMNQISDAMAVLRDEIIPDSEKTSERNQEMFDVINKRAAELMEQNPQDKILIENYIKRQQEENSILAGKVVVTTMLLSLKK
mgnify:CR=1 FL=1